MSLELANLLFPHVSETVEDLLKKYPRRPEGQVVSRIAPSPTGFMHIGTVYSGMVAEKFVHQDNKNGIFFLRIEDTDQEREVENGKEMIIDGLQTFWIQINEWPLGADFADVGNYWPYIQSHRKNLYEIFVKHFVANGRAYPCRMSPEETEAVRKEQQNNKQIPGIYGKYSKRRDASFDDQKKMIDSWTKPVIRLRSHGDTTKRVVVKDLIKWEVETQDYFQDAVILKAKDGLPTYHFAHLVDDYLMGTTHVIRADEWFASVPLHMQLFAMLGVSAPTYAHISPLLKLDEGKKRKLSKRKDPEADIRWFFAEGYPVDAIIEFLMNIVDPSFEEWQKNNPDKTYKNFVFEISHMNESGALFDLTKLNFVSKEWLAKLDKETFVQKCLEWAQQYNPELYALMQNHPEYTFDSLNIERCTELDPKRYHKYSDVSEQLPMFYDEEYEKYYGEKPTYPENITGEVIKMFVEKYISEIDLTLDKNAWFEQLKEIGKSVGFATTNAEFKEWGYSGKTGDLAMFLRIQLLLSKTTPDLCETMKVMWKERVIRRLQKAI